MSSDVMTDGVSDETAIAGAREAARRVTDVFDRAYFLRRMWDDGNTRDMWEAMGETGVLRIGVPPALGGSGAGISACVAVVEEMARAGVPPMMYPLSLYARTAIQRHGSDAQRREYITDALDGSRPVCFAVTEAEAGTNTYAITTSAVRRDDGSFVVNGTKIYISGADEAHSVMLVARTSPLDPQHRRAGISILLFPMSSPGITLRRLNMPQYAPEGQFEVTFEDVVVPESALVGTEGEGFGYLLDSLNTERLLIAGLMLGYGEFAIAKTTAYVRERAPFGVPIGSYQAVQHPLALAKAQLEAARALTYQAAARNERGEDASTDASMAKMLAAKAALAAVDAAVQSHGGHGFVIENDVYTMLPLVRVLQVAPINTEMILNLIAQHALGLPAGR
jgi:acyl-CoA dehydrogenase